MLTSQLSSACCTAESSGCLGCDLYHAHNSARNTPTRLSCQRCGAKLSRLAAAGLLRSNAAERLRPLGRRSVAEQASVPAAQGRRRGAYSSEERVARCTVRHPSAACSWHHSSGRRRPAHAPRWQRVSQVEPASSQPAFALGSSSRAAFRAARACFCRRPRGVRRCGRPLWRAAALRATARASDSPLSPAQSTSSSLRRARGRSARC